MCSSPRSYCVCHHNAGLCTIMNKIMVKVKTSKYISFDTVLFVTCSNERILAL